MQPSSSGRCFCVCVEALRGSRDASRNPLPGGVVKLCVTCGRRAGDQSATPCPQSRRRCQRLIAFGFRWVFPPAHTDSCSRNVDCPILKYLLCSWGIMPSCRAAINATTDARIAAAVVSWIPTRDRATSSVTDTWPTTDGGNLSCRLWGSTVLESSRVAWPSPAPAPQQQSAVGLHDRQ